MIVGKGGLLFQRRSPQRLLMGIADREIVAFWSLADSNNFDGIGALSIEISEGKILFELLEK